MRKIFLGAVIFFISQSSYAESQLAENQSDTVIVTATKTAQTVDDSLSSVSVITSHDIEQQNATSLQEVLNS